MKPDITVVLPIYNVEKYISKCLDSLLKQTYKNFVVWAVDDGSPDRSKEIVKKYEVKDSRIHLICKKNGGYGSVLEYCIKKISTEYFLICDPDDWLKENALEILHQYALSSKADLIVADKYDVYIENNKKVYDPTFSEKIIKPGMSYEKKFDIQKFAFGKVSPHAKFYRTSIAKNISFPHHISYTDTILYLVALENASKVIYVNKPLAYYLTNRPGNSSTSIKPKVIDDYIEMWNSLYSQLSKTLNKSPVMCLKLYDLILLILHECGRIKIKKSSYKLKIKYLIKKIKPYKKEIYLVGRDRSYKSKMVMHCLLQNNITSDILINYYLR